MGKAAKDAAGTSNQIGPTHDHDTTIDAAQCPTMNAKSAGTLFSDMTAGDEDEMEEEFFPVSLNSHETAHDDSKQPFEYDDGLDFDRLPSAEFQKTCRACIKETGEPKLFFANVTADDPIADFDTQLMQITSEHMETPEQHFKASDGLPSTEFQKTCRACIKETGESKVFFANATADDSI